MAYHAYVISGMIDSPSDVSEERETAENVQHGEMKP